MRLYVVRHAQTAWNIEGRVQGHTDVPLDAVGEGQTVRLAEAFRGVEVARVLTSDLGRSVRTAEALAQVVRAPLEIDPRLRERCFGELEGRPYQEVRDWHYADAESQILVQGPGGESTQDVWNRLVPVAERLAVEEAPTVVVTHGGTKSLLLAQLLRGTIETARAFRIDNTGISELKRRPDGYWTLVRFNDVRHLDP